jgi:arsenate reductase-like glutaredoxin family protein
MILQHYFPIKMGTTTIGQRKMLYNCDKRKKIIKNIKSHGQTAQSRNYNPKEKSQSLLKTWLFFTRQLPAFLLSFQSSPK